MNTLHIHETLMWKWLLWWYLIILVLLAGNDYANPLGDQTTGR